MSIWSNLKNTFVALRSGKRDTDESPTKVGDFQTKQPLLKQLQQQWTSFAKMEIAAWRKAVDLARQPLMPRRWELLKIYRDSLFDAELRTAIRNALIEIQAAPYLVLNESGVEDKAKKALFDKSWFLRFLEFAFNEELYGYSLLEFDPRRTEGGEFVAVNQIPHEHYKPETNQVLFYAQDTDGTPVEQLTESGAKLLPIVSDPTDLGLLVVASKAVIRKNYTETDWSIHNEKIGKPFIWLQTPSRDKKELERREDFLSKFADNNYGMGDVDEKFNFLEPSSVGNRYLAYKDFLEYQDLSIDKLINGQTGTTNNEAWAGTAEVHERTQGQYTKSRLVTIQHYINDILIPFLIREGYPLKGYKFQFLEVWENAPKPNAPEPTTTDDELSKVLDPLPSPIGKNRADDEKKKPNQTPSVAARLQTLYNKVSVCCDHPNDETPRRVELATMNDIFEAAIKNVFDRKIKAGDLDASIWSYNVKDIWQGLKLGLGVSYTDKPDSDLVKQLRQNAFVFAAFKNHANVADMVAALVDENGQPRSFEAFRKAALQISNNYNVAWLEAEYHLAKRSAAMAVEWQTIEANKDLLPNLKYWTVGDDRVRESHRHLDEVCLPIDDEFWDSFFPPNGWGCRCYTEQTDAPIKEPTIIPDDKEVPPSMRHNVGKTKKVFADEHPVFDVPKETQKSIMGQLGDLIRDLGDLI
jgi:Phage Mu protein F like protein